MKNFIKFSLLATTIAAGGHGLLWHASMNKLEEKVHEALKNEHIQSNYTLTREGYPFALGMNIQNFKTNEVFVEEMESNVQVSSEHIQIKSQIGKIENVQVYTQNTTFDVKGTDEEGEKAHIQLNLGEIKSTASLLTQKAENLEVSDIKVFEMSEEALEVMNIEKLIAQTSHQEVKPQVYNQTWQVQMDNMVIGAHEPEKMVHINHFSTKARSENWPDERNLREAANSLQAELEQNGTASNAQLKKALLEFIQSLQDEKSMFHIDEIKVAGKEIDLNIDGQLKVVEGAMLNGYINLDLNGVDTLQKLAENEEAKQNPMLQSMLAGENQIQVSVKLENGMIAINDKPIFPLPPLTMML